MRVGVWIVAAASVATWAGSPPVARADEVAAATFVHVDSNDTLVVNPRVRGQLEFADTTTIDLEYAVDVWTSASVDVISSASPHAITEQRDELDAGATHSFGDVGLSVGYRFSTENDYTSQGGSAGVTWDFASKNSTLAANLFGSSDQVGRAGDPSFSRHVNNFGVRTSFTQVISRHSLAQIVYELGVAEGYLSSPYRRVGVGGNGQCYGSAVLCVPESNPESRVRHAVAISARRAFGEKFSSGVLYRFYIDDWGLLSNTLSLDLQWVPSQALQLGLRYRGYLQTGTDFYQSTYSTVQPYMTRDKELGPLASHRLSVELTRRWPLADMRSLRLLLSVAPIFFHYTDFVPLDRITAVQTNLALVVEL